MKKTKQKYDGLLRVLYNNGSKQQNKTKQSKTSQAKKAKNY